MALAEQTRRTKYASQRYRRWQKRWLARIRRQAERRDPEGAPRTRRGYMRGWAD